MSNRLLLRRLTADLLNALTAKGYPLGPGKRMQVEELLRQLPPDTAPEQLRTLLGPLLAASAEEQRNFYELFAGAWDRLLPLVESAGPESQVTPPHLDGYAAAETRWRRYLLAVLLVLVAVAGGVFDPLTATSWVLLAVVTSAAAAAGWLLPPRRAVRLRYLLAIPLLLAGGYGSKLLLRGYVKPSVAEPLAQERRTQRFLLVPGQDTTVALGIPGDTARLIAATTCSGRPSGTTSAGNTYTLEASTGFLTFTAGINAQPGSADSLCVAVVYASRRDTSWFIADILAATPRDSSPLAELPLPFPRNLDELTLDAEALARADFYRRYEWPLKGLLLLLSGFAVWAFLRWEERRRAKFVAEIEQRDQPPYVWHIETGETVLPDFGESMVLLLNRLRRREAANIQRLNLPATVQASVRRAGRAVFRFKEQTRPPEYLLLIDRFDANDHQARLFDALYQELDRAEVPAERFFYQGDPRVCFNEAHPQGIGLGELLHRHRDARLLVIGEGQRLLSPVTGQLAPWTALFAGWRRRALLLPKPTREWGRREQTLAGLFAISAASIQGIDLVLEQFETLEQRSPAEALRRITDAVADPFVFDSNLLGSLRRHFFEPLIRWIAACAVYPALHWDLTLYLGRFLSDPAGEPLVSSGNLRQLTRLPWFLQGRIPENARLLLLDYLAAEGLETPVRQALDALLQRAPAPASDSVAWDDYRMNVVLNELLLQPNRPRRRALEKEFARFLAAGKQPDFVAFKQLQREPTRLDLLVPARWKKYLFRHDSARFGLQHYFKLSLALLLLGLGLALAPVNTRVCSGELVRFRERALCVEGPADRLLYLEYLTREAIDAQEHARVDSLRQAVEALGRRSTAVLDTLPYYRNTAVWYYNYAVRAYNCARSAAAGCPELSTDSLRVVACDNFSRGETFYQTVSTAPSIEFFSARQLACAQPSTRPDTATFSLQGQVLDAANGQPIAGAQIQARAEAATYRSSTGATGRYVLNRVRPAARLRLEVTAAGYEGALLNLPVRTELPTIRLQVSATLREAASWKQALASDTPEAYSAYLQEFPNGPNVAEARRRLDAFASARERKAWEEAQRLNTIGGYELFLRDYPRGVYQTEATTRIANLQEQADYAAALAMNTLVGYAAFLQKHPAGANAAAAQTRLASLRAQQDEDRAWDTALGAGTPEALQRYLQAWPEGRYVEEARRRIAAATPAGSRPTMIRIAGGTFQMGDVMGDKEQADETVHTVTLGNFLLGAYEVTFEEYDAFCKASSRQQPNDGNWGRGQRPVINVSWEDAVAFCNWRSRQEGLVEVYQISSSTITANWQANGYRLPTEAEWEYAARQGGKRVRFGNGQDIADPQEINFNASKSYKKPYSKVGVYPQKTLPVGSFAPNALGLYDMSGNVHEWCWDWYGSYPSRAQSNPKGPATGSVRVLRGGSWLNDPQYCRVAGRSFYYPGYRDVSFGFRLARTL